MLEYVDQSNIVVLASHSMAILKKVCNKALWLEQGEVKGYGDMEELAKAYAEAMKK